MATREDDPAEPIVLRQPGWLEHLYLVMRRCLVTRAKDYPTVVILLLQTMYAPST